ncbi:MAG: hypothetical protein AB1601_09525 [Planctomycetota bacterium]
MNALSPTAISGHCRGELPRGALAFVGLAVVIVALHGQCFDDGLFLDDYPHYRQLREADWSLTGLTAAARLELVEGVIDLWWLPPITLRFFRPLAFGTMKLVYTLSGWNPAALHAASLVWHLAAATLLMILLRRLGATLGLAWATAALFAIHPGHVATVQWIACQTELMVTTYLLGAVLCFARFRGWPGFGEPTTRGAACAWAAAATALFVLALGCRENAVMFPLVVAALEPLVWRRRRRAALALYVAFVVIWVGYFILRGAVLGGLSVPPRPYVIPPTAPDFPRFVCDKALYYLLGEYALVPCVPVGGLPYFQERPLLFYGLSAGVVALLIGVTLRCRREPAGLLGPAWLLGFMAPTLPVFVSPHHLYLPGVGWAVAAMLILRGIGRPRMAAGRPARWPRPVMWACLVLLGALFGVVTFYCGLAIETGQAVEDCLTDEIAAAPSGLQDGDTLYVANLPLLGHYVRLAVEERTGRRNLRVIGLMWAPRLLGPATPTELTVLDDRTIEVRVAGDRYFAGPMRLLTREASGGEVPDVVDRMVDLGIRARVVERDHEGVVALRFEFARPLSDPRLHLFWGSRTRWAYEVRPTRQ